MKRLLLFLMVAVFVVMSASLVMADTPIIGDNWWSLDYWGDGTTDALPVTEHNFADDYYYSKPNTDGAGSIHLNLDVTLETLDWDSREPDAIVIRTTEITGSISGVLNGDGDSYIPYLKRESEENAGVFSGDFESTDNIDYDVTYTWDFTGVDAKALIGYLSIESNDVEITSLDFVVAKVNESPYFEIYAGVEDNEESLRSFGPLTSLNGTVDLGLLIMPQDTRIDMVLANFWNQQVEITNTDISFDIYSAFAPDLYEDEEPGFVTVTSPDIIDPALASHFQLPFETLAGSSFDITFADGGPLTLTWLWAVNLTPPDENAIGLIPIVSSSDINDDIEPGVVYVVNAEDFSGPPDPAEYTLVTSADADNYIAQIEISADVPADKQDGLAVLPLGIRMAVDVEQVQVYSDELDTLLEEEIGEDDPTEDDILEVVRKYVAFTKEWSDGTTAEIQLDDPDYKDAVDMWMEFDDEGEGETIFFTVNLLIVNGGEPGMVDSTVVNGRQYIVIYDGNLDDKFADPLKLTAATIESDDGDSINSGGGGGGCSALGFVPGVALLLLPLWMLRRK